MIMVVLVLLITFKRLNIYLIKSDSLMFNLQMSFQITVPIWMGLTYKYSMAEESVHISQLDGKFKWSEFSKSQYIQSINSQISIKRLSDYMASLDVHEFGCSDEAVQNFNKIILETAKESVSFKLRKKPHHKRKYKKSWMDQDCFTLRRTLKK